VSGPLLAAQFEFAADGSHRRPQINNNKVIKYDQQPSQGISRFSFDPGETIRNNTISGNTVLGYGPPDGR
jgi:hypothetical protein